MLAKKLLNLGLSEKEALVYLSSLELGASPVQKIAQKSGVNRATTYTNIDALMKIGLMSSYKEGKKFYFYAEAPEKILYILIKRQQVELEQRKSNIEKIIPELKAHQARSHSTPLLRYFKGKTGVKEITKEIFQGRDDYYRSIYPHKIYCESFKAKELQYLEDLRIRKNIKAKIIRVTDTELPEIKKGDNLDIPINEMDISTDISIYDNTVKIVSMKEPLSSILIKDKNISNTLKKFFDLLYDTIDKKA